MVTVKGVRRRVAAGVDALRTPPTASTPAEPAPLPSPVISPDGPWWTLFPFSAHRIELAPGLFTADDGTDAASDLRTEVVVTHAGGTIEGLSVIDLGCLEGAFSLEFARRGAARVLGVEARPLNARRCEIAASLLGLDNVSFVVDDVDHALESCTSPFDVVFASGILYHLSDPAAFLRRARSACSQFALIDTHVADPVTPFKDCSPEIVERTSGGQTYRGRTFWEFDLDSAEADRSNMLWAAWGNAESFWPLEEDLVRMILDAGFREVIKVDTSAAVDRWRVDPRSRVLYVCKV